MKKTGFLTLLLLEFFIAGVGYVLIVVNLPKALISIAAEHAAQDLFAYLNPISVNYWLILTVSILAILILFYILITGSSNKAIKRIENSLTSIENGDMMKKLPGDLKGAYKKITDSMNKILLNNKKLMGNILTSAEKTKNYVNNLLANVEDTSRSAEEIAVTISEIAKGVEIISEAATQTMDSVHRMVQSSEQIEQFSNKTLTESEEMQQATDASMGRLADLVERIRNNSDINNTLAQEVATLEEYAKQISGITMEVEDISEQTNLLALNAAIEAARAGDQGRGFAVVAEEVKKLAEQSTVSAAKIHELIAAISKQVALVAESMRTQASKAKEDVGLADMSKEDFGKVDTVTQTTVRSFHEVLDLSRQQKERAGEIKSLMEDIVAFVQQSSAGAQQAAAGAQQQSAAMEQVFELIKNLDGMAKGLNDSFIDYRKGLELGSAERSRVEKAVTIASGLVNTPAFRAGDLPGIEKLIKESAAQNENIELLAYIDSDGLLQTSSTDIAKGDDVSHRNYFRESIKGNTYQSEPYISSVTDDFCISIAVPVKNTSGAITGILLTDVNISE